MLSEFYKLIRVKNWRAYFFMFLLGLLLIKAPFQESLLLTISIIFYLAFSFAINECFDTEEDKICKKENVIAEGKIDFKAAFIISISLAFFGLLTSLLISFHSFLVYLSMVLISFLYSAKPVKLKGRAFFDFLSHSLFFGILIFFFAPISLGKLNSLIILLAPSIFLLSSIFELRNHLEDYECDKKAGLKTTVIFLGKKRAKKVVDILCLLYPFSFLIPFIFYNSLLPYIFLTFVYLVLFEKLKNYRIFDGYATLNYLLFLIYQL